MPLKSKCARAATCRVVTAPQSLPTSWKCHALVIRVSPSLRTVGEQSGVGPAEGQEWRFE